MRAVNLMPRDEARTRLELGRLPLLAAAGGIVVVTAAAFFLASSASSSADSTQAELRAVEASIAALPKGPDSAVSVGALVEERSNRVAALAAALERRTAFDRVLREISLVLPTDAWLTSLDVSAPSGVALPDAAPVPGSSPAGAGGVTIQGATYAHDAVATVLARLAVVPSLADVRLTSSELVEPQADAPAGEGQPQRNTRAKPFVTFVVSATVRSQGS